MFWWLANKGLIRAISRDLCAKYKRLKELYPSDSEESTLERVWNFWLTLNEEAIRKEGSIEKNARLDIMKEEYDSPSELRKLEHWTLIDLFTAILFIETDISSQDKYLYNSSLRVFIKNAKQIGLDFTDDYEFRKRLLNL